MIKDPILYVDYIIKSVDLIELMIGDLAKKEFIEDFIRYEAVLRRLQTIAESTQKLPQVIKDKYDQIPWGDIAGFRNILVHDYLGDLNENVLWDVIKAHLPLLKETMLKIQQELEPIK